MTDRATWLSLAERFEAAKADDRHELYDLHNALARLAPGALCWPNGKSFDLYPTDLSAIVALIERELPAAWVWTLGQNIHHRTWGVSINNFDSDGAPYSVCWGASRHTPALALCAAFCRAMAERAGEGGDA